MVVAAVTVGMAACGSDSDDSSGGGSGGEAKGGSIKIGTVGPDSYDPALLQTIQASQAVTPAYSSLLTYKHVGGAEGATLEPGLAESLPKVTNGGKTYEFKLRKGLKYSDGAPVKASDFAHSMKRVIALKGPYSSFYTGIAGGQEFQEKGDNNAEIPGIVTDDATGSIKVTLEEPDGKFPFAIGQVWAALVSPKTAPIKSLTEKPPPGVGPYKLTVQDPSREFTLTRNKFFPAGGIGSIPAGKVDTIKGVVSDNVSKMTQDVIDGKLDFMTEDPTGDQLPQVRQQYKDRIRQDPNPPNTYYFFLNVDLPPFDKLDARKAVNYAIDSNALVRVFGGRLTPGCTFLPPAVQGYKKFDCEYGDPAGKGDVAKAKELVEKSGTKGQTVTVWTNNKDPRPAIAEYYADVLSQIGYKTKIKTLDQQVYFDKVGTKSTKAQTGFTDWYQDFPHPADFFQPLLSGASLQSTPTSNQGFVNDPELNKKIDEYTKAKTVDEVASKWGDLDEYVVNEKAYIVPYGYEESTSFFSPRMNFEECNGVHPVYKNDWTVFCLKK